MTPRTLNFYKYLCENNLIYLYKKKRKKFKHFFFEIAFSLRAQIKIYLVFAGVALLTHKLKCCLPERTHMHANTHPHTHTDTREADTHI